jgi:site-specific DNA-methyltransferase (adenine-specific)
MGWQDAFLSLGAAMRIETLAEGVVLYNADCREVLPTLGRFDAVVTDPPYELSSAGPGESHFGMSLSKFDSEEYRSIVSGFDIEEIFGLLESVVKPFNMFCFCSNKQISKIMAYNELKRSTTLLVWHKTNAAPFANGVWRGDIEYCVHARDAGSVFIGGAEEKKKVSEHPLVQDAAHPTVKPLSIISKYVKICSTYEQSILDPFMGSGTTGVAAVKLGRKFTGIEINERYFDIACRRISEALKQPDLFVEPPKPAKQEALL